MLADKHSKKFPSPRHRAACADTGTPVVSKTLVTGERTSTTWCPKSSDAD